MIGTAATSLSLGTTPSGTASGLTPLFKAAYQLDPSARLVVADSRSAKTLRGRLDELAALAMTSPEEAEAYDTREVARLVYLTLPVLSPAQRGLLYQANHGEISPLEAVRRIDREVIDFADRYDGVGNPFAPGGFFEAHNAWALGLRHLVGDETLEPALIRSAQEIVGTAGEEPPAKLLEDLTQLGGQFFAVPEGEGRVRILQGLTRIPFLLILQGITDEVTFATERLALQYRETDPETLRLAASLELAAINPNPFARARMRHRLPHLVAAYYQNYLGLSPADRISQATLLMDGLLSIYLLSGDLGPPFQTGKIARWLDNKAGWSEERFVGSACGGAENLFEGTGPGREPAEFRIQDLPPEIRAAAEEIRLTIPRGGTVWKGTLWDYLQETVSSVILTDRLPHLQRGLLEEGTANRLTRTAILKKGTWQDPEEAVMVILARLAHEASHIDFFWREAPRDPRLVKTRTLEERNAYLLEVEVLRKLFLKTRRDSLVPQIADTLLKGLAANLPLGYPLEEKTLRFDLPPGLSLEALGAYPTAHMWHYLTARGLTYAQFVGEVRQGLGLSASP